MLSKLFKLTSIALLMTASTVVYAVEPSLGSIAPYGMQRGTEVEVTFSGARLGDAEQLLLYEPGVAMKSIAKVDDNSCKATLTIAPDCPLGVKAVRVRTASGVSNLELFSVGALAIVDEKEPNSDFKTPQAVALNITVHGVVQNEDVDYFVVEAKKGQRLVAEIEGIRLGKTFFDPYVAILNAERFELSRSDDAALCRQDGVCAIMVPEDGKYILEVRETSYGGNGASNYRLHVGNFPRPTTAIPAGGKPGETIEVKFLGDPAGEFTQKVTLPTTVERPEFELFPQDAQGISPSPNVIRVVDLPNAVEAEPNESIQQATAATAPGALNGLIEKAGDIDFFKFTAQQGQQLDIRVFARNPLRSTLDSVLYVLNAQGGTIAGNDDSAGPDSYLRFAVPAAGDYYIMLHDHLKAGGPDYGYRVEIAPVKAELVMSLPEKQQYIPTTVTCFQDNRVAALIACTRNNFGGDLTLDIQGLPSGMTIQAPPLTANLTMVPVLFSATPDAPTGGALADVLGRTTDPNLKIDGRLNQRTMLVRGQNNIDVYGHNAYRMAVALGKAVPFKIEIVQPKVPIARNGSMDLKIKATRAADFKAPISVTFLYNPPGIGSSGSITIPEGQTEASIPVTANSGAAIGKWPIVIQGRAGFGGGTVEVATQMAELEIVDSFFNFAFQKTAGELGKEAGLVIKVEKKVDFPETAKVELLGLPANTSTAAEPLNLTKDTAELIFPIKIAENATPNTYKSLVCRTTMIREGEPITLTLGAGELRVDRPPPPKPNAPAPAAIAAAPAAPAPAAPPAKPLSRLEQLRLQKQQEQTAKK
jgi:hypothetical protein